MTIGIDIRVLARGARTGVEDYTINLLSHLISLDKSTCPAAGGVKYKFFYSGFRRFNLKYPWLKLPNVKIKKIRIPNRIFDLILKFIKIPKLDKLLGGVDIFISPHFLITPLSKKTKRIMIFYDLSFLRFPKFFSFSKRIWHRFMSPRKQAKKADLIITISESTKQDLIDFYKIDPNKIKVIYPGVDDKFKVVGDKTKLIETKNKYNLPDDFILYFGTIEPRKNILGLIKAFEEIKKEKFGKILDVNWQGFEGVVRGKKDKVFDFSKLKLVIAGTKGWLYGEIFKGVEISEFKDDIIFVGFIDEEDKSCLYNLAKIFVYPSFFEGFGLPPLEAMACGVPTIVSNKSSLPEVVGSSAIMIDPQNLNEISWAIKEILENQELSNYLVKTSTKHTKQFNWDKTAKEILQLCE
ncbi:MAG: glycosyltransferase family 1 protein [Candidatus Portnoybacteria bacterium]|nr:glycosyltransferase family 1 protein [Candidatus Portnoybacteria bacterium]